MFLRKEIRAGIEAGASVLALVPSLEAEDLGAVVAIGAGVIAVIVITVTAEMIVVVAGIAAEIGTEIAAVETTVEITGTLPAVEMIIEDVVEMLLLPKKKSTPDWNVPTAQCKSTI